MTELSPSGSLAEEVGPGSDIGSTAGVMRHRHTLQWDHPPTIFKTTIRMFDDDREKIYVVKLAKMK